MRSDYYLNAAWWRDWVAQHHMSMTDAARALGLSATVFHNALRGVPVSPRARRLIRASTLVAGVADDLLWTRRPVTGSAEASQRPATPQEQAGAAYPTPEPSPGRGEALAASGGDSGASLEWSKGKGSVRVRRASLCAPGSAVPLLGLCVRENGAGLWQAVVTSYAGDRLRESDYTYTEEAAKAAVARMAADLLRDLLRQLEAP